MRIPFLFVLVLFAALVQSSCKKDPIVQTIHADTTITGNQPPNYTGVPTLNIRLYVNKMYVDILGREATDAELNANTNLLVAQNLSEAARLQIADALLNDTAYYQRLLDITSADFLDGNGEAQTQLKIQEFTYIYDYADSLNDEMLMLYYATEIGRLNTLLSTKASYAAGSISINEFFRRFTDNYFYDQINMGSENYVKATFDDLFRRPPTDAELASGVTMVDGFPAVLLLTDGTNKNDYMNIVVNADAFYEGLVRKAYLQLLLREPATQEIGSGVALVKPNGDYKALQKQLLISPEYAGF
ncbi:MAG TPA: hypothetical protein VEY71_06165 [Chitinophagales bacterium]|nr:hypothetical protein [Chitinophagales bacterium]